MESFKHRVKYRLSGFTLRIRSGPLKGLKWSMASGSRFILGTYEQFKTDALVANLEPGETVFDVGAHVGYYTIVASIEVGESGSVFAFEPRPLNYCYLARHVRINDVGNVRLSQVGVASKSGRLRFNTRTGTGTGHISADGPLEIDVISIDDELKQGRLPRPDFIKIDVEGGETEVLQGCEQTVSEHRPKFLVATHDQQQHEFVMGFLKRHGYRIDVLDPGKASGDVEILAAPAP